MGKALLSESELRSYPALPGSIDDLTLISESTNSDTAVYRVEFSNVGTKFVRVLTEQRLDDLRAVESIDSDLGFPEYQLIDGDPTLLMMEPASGVPLSRLLPLGLLPGAWFLSGSHLKAAINQCGQHLGCLHSSTEGERCLISETPSLPRYFNFEDQIVGLIGESAVEYLREKAVEISEEKVQCSRVHADPTPHNIFYDGADTTLIDFRLRNDAVVTDLIKAERGIELMVDRLPYGRQSQKEILVHSFRDGYCSQMNGFSYPEEYPTIRCLMDISLLENHLSNRFDKRGALIARQTDVSILKTRILSEIP